MKKAPAVSGVFCIVIQGEQPGTVLERSEPSPVVPLFCDFPLIYRTVWGKLNFDFRREKIPVNGFVPG